MNKKLIVVFILAILSFQVVFYFLTVPQRGDLVVYQTKYYGKDAYDIAHTNFFNKSLGCEDSAFYVVFVSTNMPIVVHLRAQSGYLNGTVIDGDDGVNLYDPVSIWETTILVTNSTLIYIFLLKDDLTFYYNIQYIYR